MMLIPIVRLELAEYLRGRLELLRREALVANDQHVMVDESPVQGLAVLRLDRLPKIEAGHLGAGMIRQRSNGERGHRLRSRNLKPRYRLTNAGSRRYTRYEDCLALVSACRNR